MKTFVLFTYGFETPTEAVMQAWGAWFASIGDRMVGSGGPFGAGTEVTSSGVTALPLDAQALTGYVVVEAASLDEARAIAQACPTLTSVRVYETMPMAG